MIKGVQPVRWIVGGPGRCGKTHLVMTLRALGSPVIGFPLEALFTVFNRRKLLFLAPEPARLAREYLERDRYTDAARAQSEKPSQYFSTPSADLVAALPPTGKHPIQVIGWLLDRFARDHQGKGWAAFDLHPEFYYPAFRRLLPGLKLAVMVRDPREAVAAALCWRGVPEAGTARDGRFKHSLLLYVLSHQTARMCERRWPDDVVFLDFNALTSGDAGELDRVARAFEISASQLKETYRFKPDFQHQSGEGFLTRYGRRSHFLTPVELAEVAALTRVVPATRAKGRQPFLAFARAVLALGRISPNAARTIVDWIYYPRRTMTRRINVIRQLAGDLIRKVQGRGITTTKPLA